ncbi:hypothetical protein [Pseudophaeobacter sp.]|uniref:hypothetical protein n=1 Tax=Pseudophaeobacter sp. TaxID=1971739 RepID=UPI003299D262
MTETEMITSPASPATLSATPGPATVPAEVLQSMQGQAAGMIALDVESFSNGFMQIMLAGIGWASAEIASTEGEKGEKQLTFFTEKLSVDLPLIIQNITAATNGDYTPPIVGGGAQKQAKGGLFKK